MGEKNSNRDELQRTHKCGEINENNIEEKVVIMGWVQKRRNLGGVIFLDVRDRSGMVQVVFDPDINRDIFSIAENLRSEYVIAVEGKVRKRPEGNINLDLPTGKIELVGKQIKILEESKTPPFLVEDEVEVGEDLRLEYRYIDLRRPKMKNILHLRHKVMKKTRDFLDNKGFWEIETPILTKSTPEGARDYLVPSRIHTGKFYALPQSPQLFKQILMSGGIEKYFQISRCFRDEDLRANRQPEFTQIDMEMSFVNKRQIFSISTDLMKSIFALADIEVPDEIPVMTYDEAINKYGTDKPDLRFNMLLQDISDIVKDSEFNIFRDIVAKEGKVKGIKISNSAEISRSKIDEYTDYVKKFQAKGLAWMVFKDSGVKSPISKFLSSEEIEKIKDKMNIKTGDLALFVADESKVVHQALGNLRLKIAREKNLVKKDKNKFVWIVNFPLMEFDEKRQRYIATHHPFTSPLKEDISLLDNDPSKVRANSYDLVLNGEELGGGSIRINNKDLQYKVFEALNFDIKEAEDKFGFLLEAFDYGTPPHGGIAFGLDRIIMILSGANSIRDVIAFPKTQNATSPLTKAPSSVSKDQLEELHISVKDSN
ncbi:MAG: aspartate--tRNA ligase [Halanaerobiales bacterium]